MTRSCLCLLILLSLPAMLPASPLFDDTAIIRFTLDGPVATVIDAGKSDQQYPFTLQISDETLPVKVRARGNSRLRVCDFPPLMLNFPDVQTTVFAGQNKLKLVSHCRDKVRAEKDLLEEYLAYRLFNLLTPDSLRVRLAQVSYRNAGEELGTHYALLLEPEAQIAERLEARLVRKEAISLKWLDQDHAALVYVFAYLIGNTDWSLVMADNDSECCHNGILLEPKSGAGLYIPYDFDLSGLVNASYARPDPSLRIRKVTIRRYRGYCTDEAALAAALVRIQAREPDMMAAVDQLPLLTESEKARKKQYLSNFFREAGNPEKILRKFVRQCLG